MDLPFASNQNAPLPQEAYTYMAMMLGVAASKEALGTEGDTIVMEFHPPVKYTITGWQPITAALELSFFSRCRGFNDANPPGRAVNLMAADHHLELYEQGPRGHVGPDRHSFSEQYHVSVNGKFYILKVVCRPH